MSRPDRAVSREPPPQPDPRARGGDRCRRCRSRDVRGVARSTAMSRPARATGPTSAGSGIPGPCASPCARHRGSRGRSPPPWSTPRNTRAGRDRTPGNGAPRSGPTARSAAPGSMGWRSGPAPRRQTGRSCFTACSSRLPSPRGATTPTTASSAPSAPRRPAPRTTRSAPSAPARQFPARHHALVHSHLGIRRAARHGGTAAHARAIRGGLVRPDRHGGRGILRPGGHVRERYLSIW